MNQINAPNPQATPRGAQIPDEAMRPIHRIVVQVARFVALGQFAARHGGGNLQQQRDHRQPWRHIGAIENSGDAERGKRQEQIEPSHAEEDVDALRRNAAPIWRPRSALS